MTVVAFLANALCAISPGEYKAIIEGNEVVELYSGLKQAGAFQIGPKMKSLQFGLHSKEHLAGLGIVVGKAP